MVLPVWCLVLLAAAPGPADDDDDKAKAPAEPSLTADVGARLQTLVGTQLVGPTFTSSVAVNFVLEPAAIVQQRSLTGKLTLSYIPWLLYTPSEPDQVLVFHRFAVAVQQSLSRTVGLTLNARLWYGDQTFSPVVALGVPPGGGAGQGPSTPTTPGQVPNVNSVNLLDTSASMGFYIETSRVLRLDFTFGYAYSEGTTIEARQTLPLQRGPFIEAKSTLKLDFHDILNLSLRSGLLSYGAVFRESGTTTETGSTVVLSHYNTGLAILGSEATGRYIRKLNSTLTLDVGGGIGIFAQTPSYDVPTTLDADLVWLPRTPVPGLVTVYPLFETDIRKEVPVEGETLSFTAGVGLRPTINQFSGTVVERGDLSGTATWGVGEHWLFGALAEVAAAYDPKEFDARAEVRATFEASPHVLLSLGGRVAYLNYATPGAFNGLSWVVFFNVSAATAKLGSAAASESNTGVQGFPQ